MVLNLVPQACDPREGTWGSVIIRCRKPGILAKIELRIPCQRPIRFLPETDYPRASRSFPRIAGSGNEIEWYWTLRCNYTMSMQIIDSLIEDSNTEVTLRNNNTYTEEHYINTEEQ
jgi:hypothetical protein